MTKTMIMLIKLYKAKLIDREVFVKYWSKEQDKSTIIEDYWFTFHHYCSHYCRPEIMHHLYLPSGA